ncbi:MAG: DUF1295 domain-containing protein [Cyanobacteria bacterium HKST-UBA01]|nr:DUF1295 domain-containing protein [Cyanobacteria bacterium HKST-UBA01]
MLIDLLYSMAGALLVASLMMSATWLISKAIKNAGIVDVAWALGYSIMTVYYLVAGHHQSLRLQLLSVMVILWSLRLTWHLGTRFLQWYPEEDARYTELREKLGDNKEWKMYTIFLWQGAVLCFMSAPLAVTALDAATSAPSAPGAIQYAAICLWAISLIGVTLADKQLSDFKKAHKGRTCQVGLWKYSRHPNYFFEWLGALSFSLFVIDMPLGLLALSCPLVLLHLLINVTGVKPAEEHSLKTRPDYAAYVKTTSPFFPWWRKQSS